MLKITITFLSQNNASDPAPCYIYYYAHFFIYHLKIIKEEVFIDSVFRVWFKAIYEFQANIAVLI